jgi:hypothetical protein
LHCESSTHVVPSASVPGDVEQMKPLFAATYVRKAPHDEMALTAVAQASIDCAVLLVPGSVVLGHEKTMRETHLLMSSPKDWWASEVSHLSSWTQTAVARSVHCEDAGAEPLELPPLELPLEPLPLNPPLDPPGAPSGRVSPPPEPLLPSGFESLGGLLLEHADA